MRIQGIGEDVSIESMEYILVENYLNVNPEQLDSQRLFLECSKMVETLAFSENSPSSC